AVEKLECHSASIRSSSISAREPGANPPASATSASGSTGSASTSANAACTAARSARSTGTACTPSRLPSASSRSPGRASATTGRPAARNSATTACPSAPAAPVTITAPVSTRPSCPGPGMLARVAGVWVGTSGWRYPPWRGTFYPRGLAQRRELQYLSRRVSSIEINGSFYSLQRPESYRAWAAQTPDDFVFSVKGGRFITHLKQLREVATPLANFFASGVLALGRKLGPVLWQLPPRMPFDPARLEPFLAMLPRSTAAAAELAAHHDERLDGRVHLEVDDDRPLRHALEVRHPTFCRPEFVELLREQGVALVVADTAGTWPHLEDVTADFV